MSIWSSLENLPPVETPWPSAEAGHQGSKKCIANVEGWRAQQVAGTQNELAGEFAGLERRGHSELEMQPEAHRKLWM